MRRLLLVLAMFNGVPIAPPTETVIPWAWERREDLRFLGEGHTVAYYAGLIILRGHNVVVEPRRNPLLLADRTRRIAVIRLETRQASLDMAQRDRTVAEILRLARDAEELQIDFDATRSQRAFYRALLVSLRAKTDRPLSITALASWCMEDRWLDELTIDDAVPMLFRMGQDAHVVRARLTRGDEFQEARCRASAGLSVDEPLPRIPHRRRLWIFNPDRWTESTWASANARAR